MTEFAEIDALTMADVERVKAKIAAKGDRSGLSEADFALSGVNPAQGKTLDDAKAYLRRRRAVRQQYGLQPD